MNLKIKFLIAVLLFAPALFAKEPNKKTSKGDFETYKRNAQISGLQIGKATLKEVYQVFGQNVLKKPPSAKDSSWLCYKSANGKTFLIIESGRFEDYETLHGFELTSQPPEFEKQCLVSEKLDELKTLDGIALNRNKNDLVKILGEASQKKSSTYVWNFEHHQIYKKPVVTRRLAGPKGERYTLVVTARGWFYSPVITAKFKGDQLMSYRVFDYGEADAEITQEPLK